MIDIVYLIKCILKRGITQEDYEEWQFPEVLKMIEEEPNVISHYTTRSLIRSRVGDNKGVIEDESRIIKIVLDSPECYPNYDLSNHYFIIGKCASYYGKILSEKKDLQGAVEFYKLSISSFQKFFQFENRFKMVHDEGLKLMNETSQRLDSINDCTEEIR